MNFKYLTNKETNQIETLFNSAFSDSEGIDEGRIIGSLSKELASDIDDENIFCFGAFVDEQLVGCIFFSKLFIKTETEVYMLSPVAVDTKHQGEGIGQKLINFGLKELKNKGVDVAVTYGSSDYYSKVGFKALSEDVIKAPYKLSIPEGWLGQSLTGSSIPNIEERPSCVIQFQEQSLW
ncbi:MAG: GNAT family N-acetyltransferase [Bacteroidales bacterium]